jgi:hypothetical protein
LPNQFVTNPVDRLQVLLGNRLDGNKTHRRPTYRFTNSLGIVGIVLVALDVGFNKLWRNQLHGMALLLQLPGPIMGPTSGFYPYQTGC